MPSLTRMNVGKSIRIQHDCQGIDWVQLAELFKSAKMAGRKGDKIRRAFEKSTLVCFAFDGPHLIGAARALSDHEYHATIYDVVFHPAYQRQGLGTHLMSCLLGRLSVWRVLLVADDRVKSFYKQLGFDPYGDVMARIDRTKLYDSTQS